jgi:hypothetical protein
MVSAWPPLWAASFQPGRDTMAMPGDGVLETVMRHEDDGTLLRLTMRFDAREHTGILTWDAPPLPPAVESLLKANLGREIRAIGDLDI